MTDTKLVSEDRRKLMKAAAAGAGAAALFGGFGFNPLVAQALAKESRQVRKAAQGRILQRRIAGDLVRAG